ncbi:TfoX/Sxy family protein [Ideonella sp. DXS22W]|uniref:TfoX/Sxy family protein n=1 Tax=Pseudaquabacterium inlustre TaxID=2984192 RepID=A0ABU9CRL0_9BURK
MAAHARPDATDAGFTHHCLELLAALGRPQARRMFGGQGLFVEALMVGLIVGERLYLKADAAAQPEFAAAGAEPFGYDTRGGRRVLTSYWSAPDEAMDSPAAMQPWARLALASALRAAASKAAPSKPRARASAAQPAATGSAPVPGTRRRARPA